MTAFLPDLRTAAWLLGGEIDKDGQINCPGPGHSRADRSLRVKLDPSKPSGFSVHSCASDDWKACQEYVADRFGLDRWERPETVDDIIEGMAARARKAGADGNGGCQDSSAAEKSRIVAEYVYNDAHGEPYARVIRYESKEFRQQHWNGTGWSWGKHKGPKVPYRLPELLEAVGDEVFVCEGEKDADALAAHGFVATSASEGAGKWTPDLNPWFKGRIVYILADNDDPGRAHARQVAENLHGVAAEVRIVASPGLPEKGDVSDWLAAGNDPGGLIDLCRMFPAYEPGAGNRQDNRSDNRKGPTIASAADLRRKVFPDIKWIVPGYLAEGCILLAGRPKLGKSWLALDIGLAVAAGRYVLGDILCEPGDVLCLALEDNERRLQRRITKVLGAFGAEWPERFRYATEWPRANDGGLDAIRSWIEAADNPRLVVVDVLAMFRPARGDRENMYEADYGALKGLQELAGRYGIAILVIHHTRKSGAESGDVVETISGTLSLSGAADAFLVLNRDGQGYTLAGRGRDVEEVDVAVAFDKPSCRWRVMGEAAEVRRTDERTVILVTLKEASKPMSPAEIADAIGVSRNNVKQLLFKMAKAFEVEKVGTKGRYIHPERNDLRGGPSTSGNHDNRVTGDDEEGFA